MQLFARKYEKVHISPVKTNIYKSPDRFRVLMGKNSLGIFEFIRKTSFLAFFIAWMLSLFVFAIIYWMITLFSPSIALQGVELNFSIIGLFKNIYVSFLIATLLGISLIKSTGIATAVVYLQAAISIGIILIILDKLFQKYIVPHYNHYIHQDKKINSLMLAMSIFRNDVDRLMHELRSRQRHELKIKEIEAIIDGLYVALIDIEKLFSEKNIERHRIRNVQYLMLTTNIENSLENLDKFIIIMNNYDILWKDKSTEFWIRRILETADKIIVKIDHSRLKNPQMIIAIENIKEYTQRIEMKI